MRVGAGYIKLHREIQDGFLWNNHESFDKRSAWIDLLLLANWKTHDGIYDGKLMTFERGCVYLSKLELSRRWNWDSRKVTHFLELLEKAGKVHVSSTTHGTTIRLIQYDLFQSDGTTDDITNAQQIAQPMHTNKKDNKVKKDNLLQGIERNEDLDAMMMSALLNRKGV